MFLFYSLVLATLVYMAPALALRPQLVLNPRTFLAVPLLSVLVVYLLSLALILFESFEIPFVRGVSIALALVACIRVYRMFAVHGEQGDWPQAHRHILLFNVFVALIYFAKLATSGFETDDEIYSWNMWAVQHFLNQPVDFSITIAPYPQLFPLLLSYSYKLAGSVELQLIVKSTLFVLPFTMLSAIGLATTRPDTRYFLPYVLLVILLVWGVGLGRLFENGMPDMLMGTAVICSLFFFTQYQRHGESIGLLVLSVLCACLALLSKQPGLVWGLVSLPALLFIEVVTGRQARSTLLWILIPAAVAGLWYLLEGQGFQNNPGVLQRSLEDRNYFQQLVFGTGLNLSESPAIVLLIVLALAAISLSLRGAYLFLLFLLPGYVAWLVFASYDMRAGVYAIAGTAFVISWCNYGYDSLATKWRLAQLQPTGKRLAVFIGALFAANVLYGYVSVQQRLEKNPDFDFYGGGKNTIYKYFGEDAQAVYEITYVPGNLRLWIESNYIYGIFYGRAELYRPSRYARGYDASELLEELRQNQPDYLFHGGIYSRGQPGRALLNLVKHCPLVFPLIAGPVEKFQYSVYSVDKALLFGKDCTL